MISISDGDDSSLVMEKLQQIIQYIEDLKKDSVQAEEEEQLMYKITHAG